jgi:ParB family chromosome partitioning protein
MGPELQMVGVDEISVGPRHRKALGDIATLAKSIAEVGLLQPLVVTNDLRLVAGARRLAAVKELGWRLVPARVYVLDGFVEDGFDAGVDGFDDALGLLKAERDENTCRKDFTPSEAVAIGRALEELEREQARARQRATRAARGRKVGAAQGGGKLPPPSGGRGKTRDRVAEAVGMSGRTYEKARKVVEAAEADPAILPLVEDMDRTGKVDPAYKKVAGKKVPPTILPAGPKQGRREAPMLSEVVHMWTGQLLGMAGVIDYWDADALALLGKAEPRYAEKFTEAIDRLSKSWGRVATKKEPAPRKT